MNDILLIGATHGNEPLGVRAIERLRAQYKEFDGIVGSPDAFARNCRGFQGDLNRSGPGDPLSERYSARRAFELLALARRYREVIDLHSTGNDTGLFVIVTNPTPQNLRLAGMLPIRRVVLLPSIRPDLKGPLSEFFNCGVEIECGLEDDPATEDALVEALAEWFDTRNAKESEPTAALLADKELFVVYDALTRPVAAGTLRDFVPTCFDGESFVPLFVDAYTASDVTCYKMRQVDRARIASLLE